MQNYEISYDQVPKVMVVDSTIKREFSVVLDTNSTASFSGSQFNASFPVDFKTIIREQWRLKKSYYMSFQFLSRASTFAVSGITSNKVYTLHIDMGKGQNIFRYSNVKVPSGFVRTSTQGTGVWTVAAGIADVPVYFDARDTDNHTVFLDNLLDITTININLLDTTNNTTFNSANDATINTATKYICILTLLEA